MHEPDDAPHTAAATALPKVLLHEHLDGGLRVATLLELLQARGRPSPAAMRAASVLWKGM